jgi:sugar lactone lactonase YvrE
VGIAAIYPASSLRRYSIFEPSRVGYDLLISREIGVTILSVKNVGSAILLSVVISGGALADPSTTSLVPSSATAGSAAFTMVVNGANFNSTSVVRWNGSNRTTSFFSTTQLQASILASDIATGGTAQVVVFNADTSTTSNAQTFTINNPTPVINSLSPSTAVAGGPAFTLVVLGTGFVATSIVNWNFPSSARPTTFVSGGELRASISASDIASVGQASVFVVTPGGSNSAPAGFTITGPAPTISSITPSSGSSLGGTAVSIGGTNFQLGATVTFGGQTAASVTVNTPTSISASTPSHAAGAVDVTVRNPDGGMVTSTRGFSFNGRILSVQPASGPISGGTSVAVQLDSADSVGGVTFGGVAATITNRTPAIGVTVTSPQHAAGPVDVVATYTIGGAATLANGFTYTPPATITSVTPNSGPAAGGTPVTIKGTNFGSPFAIGADFGGVPVGASIVDSTTITATTPVHQVGAVTVSVSLPTGERPSLANAYTYLLPAPTITSISPTSGTTAGGTQVTITGTNFVPAGAQIDFGGISVTAAGMTASQMSATTPPHSAGAVNVKVTNPDGQSATLPNGFTYISPPTISSINPASGPASGGTAVTIIGAAFVGAALVTLGGVDARATVVNATTINATTPPHAAGSVDVTVTNPGGQSGTLANGFTYVAAGVPAAERQALIDLYNSTNGAAWTNKTNWLGAVGTECTWAGVVCDSSPSVIQLVLRSNRLAGPLPASISNLTNLNLLSLESNQLSGSIPAQLGNLSQLRQLFLFSNQLSGNIPAQLGTLTNLQELRLESNQLRGSIPTALTGLTNLISGRSDIRFNALYSTDPALITFLNSKLSDPAWQIQETVAPANLSVSGATSTAITVNWSPIAYTAGGGFYQVFYATSSGGPYTAFGSTTPSLSSSSQTVSGLTANTTYYFVVQTTTLPSSFNQNTVKSDFSGEKSGLTLQAPSACTAPSISVQPQSTTITSGQTATLSVTASGSTPLTYQWYIGSSGSTANPVAGGTNSSVTVSPTSTTAYWVRVTGQCSPTADSATATVTVNPASASAPTISSISPNSGPTAGGIAVTITGSNFANGATVSFGGTASGSVTFVSVSQLRTIAPQHAAGAVSVTVTNPDGQSATQASGFTYTDATVSVLSFTADRTSLNFGESTKLRWTTSNASYVNITGVGSLLPPNALENITPRETTTYLLTAYSSVNANATTATASVTVTVTITQAIVYFAVNPPQIRTGERATLSWATVKATAVSIDNLGPQALIGSILVAPLAATTYRLTALGGPNGTETATATLSVIVTSPPVINSFTANPETITTGQPTTLIWSSVNGTTADINPGVGLVPTSGSKVVTPRDSVIYSLWVEGLGGAVTKTASVRVGQKKPPDIGTLAGTGGYPGSDDGSARNARFRTPWSITVDNKGNTIIADSGNNTIRRVSPDGHVDTIAGNPGQAGSKDGKGRDALFNFEFYGGGVATDRAGNIFVSDTSNNTIRKLAADGTVTTIAGSAAEAPGFTDGPALGARFNSPSHLVVDARGIIYVADTSNHTIRKITPDGVVSTVAGVAGLRGYADGPGTIARFNLPHGLTIDAAGNLYVGDVGNDAVRRITPDGIVTTLAGGPNVAGKVMTNANASTAKFNFGCCGGGLAIDADGNILVADRGSQTIRSVTSDGQVSTIAGSGAKGSIDGPAPDATFNNPIAVATDNTGRLYVADTDNHAIRATQTPTARHRAVRP